MEKTKKNRAITFELCIPAYNETDIILPTIQTLTGILKREKELEWSITVADNGSTDGTGDIVEKAAIPNVYLLKVKGKGKGLAIKKAAKNSDADIFGFIDADLSANPEYIIPLINCVQSGKDIVIGSRLKDTSKVNRSFFRTLTSKMFRFFSRLFLGINAKDTQCGLKIFNKKAREILIRCKENNWFLDLEFLARSERAGLTINEIPVEWEEFWYEKRKSKLSLIQDGVRGFVAVLRIYRNLQNKDEKGSF